MQGKPQLVDSIMQINPTASPEWLDRFGQAALARYLDHLEHAREPRGRDSFWFRDGETTAVVARRAAG